MPLYMDIHTVDADTFSVEDVVKAHMEDLSIQSKFGVTQLKYWVNEEAKTLFCLMEGPDKEACHQVHKQSHGNTACNIIEVSDNEYNLFMGVGTEVNDLAKTQSGHLDTGYRTILLANIVPITGNREHYFSEVRQLIEKFNGVLVLEPGNELMVSFIYASEAILCANAIQKLLDSTQDKVEYNLAIGSGRPVDEQGANMFEETKKKVQCLCSLGLSKKMYLDEETRILMEKEFRAAKVEHTRFTLVHKDDFKLALALSKMLARNLTQPDFNSTQLTHSLALSKSQAYRIIKSLTGMAQNKLIHESRLQRAINQMTQSKKTIAEIAYESGFNSPTYFSRAFRKRFEISPKDFGRR